MIFPILSCNFALCIANDAYIFKITWCRLISMDIYNIWYIYNTYPKFINITLNCSTYLYRFRYLVGATKLGILLISLLRVVFAVV